MNAEKDALRKSVLLYRKALPPQEKAALDAAIAARVLRSGAYLTAKTVFCYVSLPHEIDTRPILEDAWRRGKRVAVPRCRANGQMAFYAVDSFGDLSPGMLGISEPKEDRPLCLPQQSDLCIVPCLAASESGDRLGYGGGYYDRYLSGCSVRTVGLCYASCVTRAMPTEPFDVPLQMIVTEKEV